MIIITKRGMDPHLASRPLEVQLNLGKMRNWRNLPFLSRLVCMGLQVSCSQDSPNRFPWTNDGLWYHQHLIEENEVTSFQVSISFCEICHKQMLHQWFSISNSVSNSTYRSLLGIWLFLWESSGKFPLDLRRWRDQFPRSFRKSGFQVSTNPLASRVLC